MVRLALVSALIVGCGSRTTTAPSTSTLPSDAGAVTSLDDAGQVTAADAGSASAGAPDAGLPPLDAGQPDGGPVMPALNIQPQTGAACATWLPGPASPSALPPSPLPDGGWTDLFTDGAGDLAGVAVVFGTWTVPNLYVPAPDGRMARMGGAVSDVAAMPDGFIFQVTATGPCMVCGTDLGAWPGAGSLFVGDGYPWHGFCSYAARPQGGVYASCEVEPFMGSSVPPPTFQQLDESLAVTSQVIGIAPHVAAVDRLDGIVEALDGGGSRWIDANGNPISDTFDAPADHAFPLIGGGLLTTDDRVIHAGQALVEPAPAWLRGRAASAFVVLGERGYAFTDASCNADIYSAAGEFCGRLQFPGCSAPPRFGPDGSAIVPLDGGGWGFWSRLLR